MILNWFVGLNLELIIFNFYLILLLAFFFLLQIFIPLNIANVHWILVVVDTEKGSVQICDSMRSTAVTEREETVNHVVMY